MHKIDLNDKIEREWDERAKLVEDIRKKLRRGWRNDKNILQEYFRACVINWKAYTGIKPDKVVAKLYGLYKQAVFGDCDEIFSHDMTKLATKKWQEWNKLKGTSSDEAKRRFLTYLAEFDPLLIDVMPNEVPPEGFPTDNKGNLICAKCNSKVGCHRPLMDQNGTVLRRQLFEVEELHQIDNLREWVQNALQNQRCLWGVHKPITRVEAKKFTEWYNRSENQGYYMYDSSNVFLLIRDLLQLHYEITYDMQTHKNEYMTDDINEQTIKTFNLNQYYTELTGQVFIFEIECTRDIDICNKLRQSEGKNHKHPVELEPPIVDYTIHEIAVKLRKQCQELGIDPRIGIEKDMKKRCEILRERIKDYYDRHEQALISQQKNIHRADVHKDEKNRIKNLSKNILAKHVINACNENNIEKLLSLSKRGGNMNIESPRGIRPLLCLIINSATIDQLNQIIKSGALVDPINKFGINPLMLACRLKDSRTIHTLMKAGAHELVSEGHIGLGRSSLHYCVIHTSEEEARILTEYCLEGGEDALRVVRFLDQQDHNGETPLILAAKYRNGIMCRVLLSLGANPNVRNIQKRTAAYIARHHGHRILADWLDTKVSAGVAKIETFSDLNFEKNLKFANIKIKEYIMAYCKQFLILTQNRTSTHFIKCPSHLKEYLYLHSDIGLKEQSMFINRYYYLFILKHITTTNQDTIKVLEEMKKLTQIMVNHLREGICYPSAESEEKPLPWTSLMCACVMNDIRSIRLICHEGADPNYCNSHGMTALMLSSLLQNTEVICELLLLGANLDLVDNEGYTALAYSTALPLPLPLYRTTSNILFNGQNEGTKRWDAEYVLKLAYNHTPDEVKQLVLDNIEQSSGKSLEIELKHMKLLEQNGLSHIETMDDFLNQHAGLSWRVDSTEITTLLSEEQQIKLNLENNHDDHDHDHDHNINEDKIFGQNLDDILQAVIDEKIDPNKQRLLKVKEVIETTIEEEFIRCPLCTLPIPCKHFFKAQTVKEYNEKKQLNKGSYQLQTKKDIIQLTKKSVIDLKSKLSKTKYDKLSNTVLEEAQLTDRQTNRNLIYVDNYSKKNRNHRLSIENQQLHHNNQENELNLIENGNGNEKDNNNNNNNNNDNDNIDNDKLLIKNKIDDIGNEELKINDDNNQQNLKNIENINNSSTIIINENSNNISLDNDSEYIPLKLPIITSVAKPVLKKSKKLSKKKYKPHLRVIKFSLENDDGNVTILDGGVEEGDETTIISNYSESLLSINESTDISLENNNNENNENNNNENDINSNLNKDLDSSELLESSSLSSIATNSSTSLNSTSIIDHQLHHTSSHQLVKPMKYGEYTKEEEEIALKSLRSGKRVNTPITSKIIQKIGPNPVDINRRHINMFKESITKNDEKNKIQLNNNGNNNNNNTHHLLHDYRLGKTSKNDNHLFLSNITFPGWIFSGIYSIEQCYNPYGDITLPLLNWSECLESIIKSLELTNFNNYFQTESLVETHTWNIPNLRCKACIIGLVRFKSDSNLNDMFPNLCLACIYRKLLHNYITSKHSDYLTLTEVTKSRDNLWPFHLLNETINHPIVLFELSNDNLHKNITLNTLEIPHELQKSNSQDNTLHLPLISNKKTKLIVKSSSRNFSQTYPISRSNSKVSNTNNNNNNNNNYLNSSDNSPSQSRPTSPSSPVYDLKSFLKSQELKKKLSQRNDEESSFTSESNISTVTMDTISTNSSIRSRDNSFYGPTELTLIPTLLMNNTYDEIERVVRISITHSIYHTEEGIYYLLQLFEYYVEMYKLLNLWQLVIYLLFDMCDWIISKLGYDHKYSLQILNKLFSSFYYYNKIDEWNIYKDKLLIKLQKYAKYNKTKNDIFQIVENNFIEFEKYLNDMNELYLESQGEKLSPERYPWSQLYYFNGYGGFCKFIFSVTNLDLYYKNLFINYCESISDEYFVYIHFVIDCIQLQQTENEEIIKYLTNKIHKKYINSTSFKLHFKNYSNNTSPILTLYNTQMDKLNKNKMLHFIKLGTKLPKNYFDIILKIVLNKLVIYYKIFLNTYNGIKYRQKVLKNDEIYLYFHTILIQNQWRKYFAIKRVNNMKKK